MMIDYTAYAIEGIDAALFDVTLLPCLMIFALFASPLRFSRYAFAIFTTLIISLPFEDFHIAYMPLICYSACLFCWRCYMLLLLPRIRRAAMPPRAAIYDAAAAAAPDARRFRFSLKRCRVTR